MPQQTRNPPPRKAPGLLSKLLTRLVSFIACLIFALLISIIMEWIGIAFFWPEQGERHSQQMLALEMSYLDQRFIQKSQAIGRPIYHITYRINNGIKANYDKLLQRLSASTLMPANLKIPSFNNLYWRYQAYIRAVVYIAQLFFVRLAIICLSLCIFLLFAITGLVDGLVERKLRRLGGGRESSNLYNLAKRSTAPVFILACMVYISLPFSIHPALVILPFAVITGLSIRVTFDKLKKYF